MVSIGLEFGSLCIIFPILNTIYTTSTNDVGVYRDSAMKYTSAGY